MTSGDDRSDPAYAALKGGLLVSREEYEAEARPKLAAG
jgi:hypothetical protein